MIIARKSSFVRTVEHLMVCVCVCACVCVCVRVLACMCAHHLVKLMLTQHPPSLLPGTVKKCSLLKIIHVKYKETTTKQKPPLEVTEFRETLIGVSEDNKDLLPHINKAQEILNPLRVLYLFKSIPPEVRGSP